MIRRPIIALILWMVLLGAGAAVRAEPPQPGAEDRCPVCGMFVAKYPDWVASMEFAQGDVVHFDGVKDLLTFYFNMAHYQPGRDMDDIRDIHVTDYYSGRRIDAWEAFFVLGSDVFGPMGKELIPFESQAAAVEFKRDHHGTRVMRFADIRPTLLERLR